MIRFAAVVLAAAFLSLASAQDVRFGVRATPCIGTQVTLCTIGGYVESQGVGVFAQARPVAGSIADNWLLNLYWTAPVFSVDLGFMTLLIEAEPGFTVSRESGAWIVGVSPSFIIDGTISVGTHQTSGSPSGMGESQ